MTGEQSQSQTRSNSKSTDIVGWVISSLCVALLCFSAYMKLSGNTMVVAGFAKAGYAKNAVIVIGVVEIICAVLYIVPKTSILGAILLAGYLGGAICHHVRSGEPFFIPAVLGNMVWLGIFLREPRLRAILPFR